MIVRDAVGEIDNDLGGSSSIVGPSTVVAVAGGWRGGVMGWDRVPGFGGGLSLGDTTSGWSVGHRGCQRKNERGTRNEERGIKRNRTMWEGREDGDVAAVDAQKSP